MTMKKYLKQALFSILLLTGAAHSVAQGQHFTIFLGQVDVGRPQADAQYGLSWLSAAQWTTWRLQPELGVIRTRYGSHLLYAGLQRRTSFSGRSDGLALNIGIAPALYWHGNGNDTDLGYLVQFKSTIGLEYEFPDATRLGASFAHISNASLSDTNPGTELWSLYYAVPF
jgi:hypothetical protein